MLSAGAITAQQSFKKCNIPSSVFTETVLPAAPVQVLQVLHQLCSDVTKFHISGLKTPCTLYIEGTIPCIQCDAAQATIQPLCKVRNGHRSIRWIYLYQQTDTDYQAQAFNFGNRLPAAKVHCRKYARPRPSRQYQLLLWWF